LIIIPVLINVAFITLIERKILGHAQLRKGPNKVGLLGILQPFNDAIKLFSKESVSHLISSKRTFNLRPAFALTLSLFVWISLPSRGSIFSLSLSLIFFYIVLRIGIYPLIFAGWASNRQYAMIGALRGVAQTISYEVRFALVLIVFIIRRIGIRLSFISTTNSYWSNLALCPLMFGLWVIISIAETNRTPFDFAEGESELVSGFNIEYGGVGFALIFMAEYARIYFMSTIIPLIFFSSSVSSSLQAPLSISLVFLWIWVRATLPRYRYDLLINIAWASLLPVTLFILPLTMVFSLS
jgi:NADH-ubiquinone oxidoreductase chain 1